MKNLAIALNWLCVAFCLFALLLAASRGYLSGGAALILPFATAIAVFHWQRKAWLVYISVGLNGLMVGVYGTFLAIVVPQGVGEFLADVFSPLASPAVFVILLVAFVLVGVINLSCLWPFLKQRALPTSG